MNRKTVPSIRYNTVFCTCMYEVNVYVPTFYMKVCVVRTRSLSEQTVLQTIEDNYNQRFNRLNKICNFFKTNIYGT